MKRKKPARRKSAVPGEPRLRLGDIQGNVIPGFKKDHHRYLFFALTEPARARPFLRAFAERLASAEDVLRAHSRWKARKKKLGREPGAALPFLFRNLALGAPALRALTSPTQVAAFGDEAFKVGLARRSGLIKDPTDPAAPGHPSRWLFGGDARPVDVLLLLASDSKAAVNAEAKALVAEAKQNGLALVHQDIASVRMAPRPGHEQFGFRDGISEVAVRGSRPQPPHAAVYERTWPNAPEYRELRRRFAAPGKPLVWPGHVLFGYARQQRDDPTRPDPASTPKGPAWARDGSFLVYRRLRQDVKGFWSFVRARAQALRKKHGPLAPNAEKLAAMLVGRWKSGTPLVRSPRRAARLTGNARQHFAFANELPALRDGTPASPADPDGRSCPLGAHIRKVNPRDEATDLGPAERTVPKLLLRRGITYARGADRGLLFLAYQGSIVDQFEFLMRTWIHPPLARNAPRAGAGPDPILAGGGGHRVRIPIGDKTEEIVVDGGWVVATGGAYLFSPSIAFFRNLE